MSGAEGANEVDVTEIATGLRFPEGPVAMPDGTVLCTELERRTVVRVARDGTVETVAEPGGSPNGLAIGPDGAAYLCNSGGFEFHELMGLLVTAPYQPADYSGGRIERIDLATGDVKILYSECDGNPLVGPNDLVFDETGGFWFTDFGKARPRDRTHGGLYYAQPDGSSVREVVYPLDQPNGVGLSPDGVGLSPDGTRLYVAETFTGRVWAWNLKDPGEVDPTNPVLPHGGDLLCGLPGLQLLDSLAVDSAATSWSARS